MAGRDLVGTRVGSGRNQATGGPPRGFACPSTADKQAQAEYRDTAAGHNPPADVTGIGEAEPEGPVKR